MEHMHPHLRLAASLILAAGLASACSGGSSGSGTAAPAPEPTEPTAPTPPTVTTTDLEGEPSDCTAASANCIITTTAADGTMVVRRIETTDNAATMKRTRTDTNGNQRTITVTDTAENDRVDSVLTCTVSGDSCTPTRRVVTTYPAAGATGDPVTTTTVYTGGRPSSRTVGDVTTTIAYSASGGGRIETRTTSAGTRVQTFGTYSGGTAASTTFTSTDGLTVTTAHADGVQRVETVYASQAAKDAGTPASMTVGPARTVDGDATDTGFTGAAVRTFYVANPVAANPLVPSSGTLVAWTRAVSYDGDGDATLGGITSRTYITERDDDGRETERQTLMVSGSTVTAGGTATPGTDGSATTTVTTSYREAGGMDVVTVTGTTRTEVGTDADGEVTTVVRAGVNANSQVVTTTVRSPAADDGSTTVATTYDATGYDDGGAAGDDPVGGQTFTVRTNAAGTEVVTTVSTGAGDSRVVLRTVTRDQNGVETMRVAFSGTDRNTRTTTTTAYMTSGASTVTTVTATREDAESAYATASTVVVTNDAMGRVVLSVTTDKDGDETDRRATVYAADGSTRTETRHFYEAGLSAATDKLRDVGIVESEWDAENSEWDVTSDIVVHAGPQTHDIVSDAQYADIQTGMAVRENSVTVMSPAVLHLNYSDDDAFQTFTGGAIRGVNLEAEFITKSPTCAAGGCTYSGLRFEVAPYDVPEIRLFETTSGNPRIDTWGGVDANRGQPAGGGWVAFGWEDGGDQTYPDGRAASVVLHQLLSELLDIGGAGAAAKYTAPSATYVTAGLGTGVTGPRVTVTRAEATELERDTFTHLVTSGLARGVLGIGQQAKEVDSYMDLGGVRGETPDPVEVTVENYFGWMENSMFTVRRVTANGVRGAGADWITQGSVVPDATDEVRAYVGMASGQQAGRPTLRSADGMVDPGTWTGEMIGVGSVRGERYRGDAQVTVNFDINSVDTKFTGIAMARDSQGDVTQAIALDRYKLHDTLADGFMFTTSADGGISSTGSYTSAALRDLDSDGDPVTVASGPNSREATGEEASNLSANFYGDGAEVAGTFLAYGLAIGKEGEETGGSHASREFRGDIIGAFGATRDPMTEAPEDDN